MNLFHTLTRLIPDSDADAGPVEQDRVLVLDGVETAVLIRRHPRARRIKIQIDSKRGVPVLTLPVDVPEREGLAFLEKNAGWIVAQMKELPAQVCFGPDVEIPFRGIPHRIRHDPAARGGVMVDDGTLVVTGGIEHLPRRLTDFLRKQARGDIKPQVTEIAAQLGDRLRAKPGQVSLRDQRTRWGSCAANGNLSFSWRLVLAPPEVLTYVVSHEVAHLVHMDHSRAFWTTVATVCPDYRHARQWLATEGADLHRIG